MSKRALAFNMRSIKVDGQDVEAVYAAAREALEYARSGEGPVFLDIPTYRMHGHYIGDPQMYRSKEDRDANILRIGFVSKLLTRHGAGVIVAAISPYAETRGMVRDMIGSVGNFVEVYVATSLEECARRDVKGLYAKAFAGEIKEFTGVSDPYEAPDHAEVVVETEGRTPEESAAFLISELERLNIIPPVLEEAVA
jgi:hypothetical protein